MSLQGATVGGGPGEEQDRDLSKSDSVALSQGSSQKLAQQLAGLQEARQATTTALEKMGRDWAAAGAAPTGPQEARYRGCRGRESKRRHRREWQRRRREAHQGKPGAAGT